MVFAAISLSGCSRTALADVVSVHRRSLGDLNLSPTGDFDFLATLSLGR